MTTGPEIVETVEEVAGLYFRSILIPEAGTWVPQHVHDHDHATYCGQGAAEMYVNGEWVRRVEAGQAVEIKAGKEHAFRAIENNTRLTCVHDVQSAESVKAKGV
jgi:quercetin dioxygenase-like cupin family protein